MTQWIPPNVWTFVIDTTVELKHDAPDPQPVERDERGCILIPPMQTDIGNGEPGWIQWAMRPGNYPATRADEPLGDETAGFHLVNGWWVQDVQ